MDVPKEYGYISFECSKDSWSEYILKNDKTIIKIKTILLKVRDHGHDEQSLNEQSIIITYSPKNVWGTPSNEKISIKELSESITSSDLEFEAKAEEWSEYKLENGIRILFKSILISVSSTGKFDSYGEPIYLIQTQTLHKIIPLKTATSSKTI
jgi:hypothetical protein